MKRYRVEPMTAMDYPNPEQPAAYYPSMKEAHQAAVNFTMSEPWRKHAQVWIYTDDSTGKCVDVKLLWYHRDIGTRELVIDRER